MEKDDKPSFFDPKCLVAGVLWCVIFLIVSTLLGFSFVRDSDVVSIQEYEALQKSKDVLQEEYESLLNINIDLHNDIVNIQKECADHKLKLKIFESLAEREGYELIVNSNGDGYLRQIND